MPGVAVGFEFLAVPQAAVRIDAQIGACALPNGNDVERVTRDDIADDEVDFVSTVSGTRAGSRFAAGGKLISAVGEKLRALYLHAMEDARVVAGLHNEVVALAVAPRAGDDQAVLHGAVQEGSFAKLSDDAGRYSRFLPLDDVSLLLSAIECKRASFMVS